MSHSIGAGLILGERYQLLEAVADRGMGETWRVRDQGRKGALLSLKFLRKVEGDEIPPRALVAIRALKALRHDAVLTAFNHGLYDGRPWIVFDDIQGDSVGTLLDSARASDELLDLGLLRRVFTAVAGAIQAAHVAPLPMVHGTLTPGSVVVLSKPLRSVPCAVLDLGLMEWLDAPKDAPARSARMLVAKAPERSSGTAVTVATDVFALGALFTEMLALPAPQGATIAAVTEERRRPDVPAGVWKVLATAMAASPAARFKSVPELLGMLEAAWKEPPPQSRPVSQEDDAPRSLLETAAPLSGGPSLFPSGIRSSGQKPAPLAPLPVTSDGPLPMPPLFESPATPLPRGNAREEVAPPSSEANPWSTSVLQREVLKVGPLAAMAPAPQEPNLEATAVLPPKRGAVRDFREVAEADVGQTLMQADAGSHALSDDVGATMMTPPKDGRGTLEETINAGTPGIPYSALQAPMMNEPGMTLPARPPSDLRAVVPAAPSPAPSAMPSRTSSGSGRAKVLLIGGFAIVFVLVAFIAFRLGSR